jgi:uncharacterized membrane protein HdeD (DUF308 family)
METRSNEFEAPVRHWRRLIIIGLFFIIAGIAFFKTHRDYLTLKIVYLEYSPHFSGVSILLTVPPEIKRHHVNWTLTAGIFEILVGIWLLFLSSSSEITLPFVLGFWVMFRALFMMGAALELKNINIPGWGLIMAGGIADLILVFLVFYSPARDFISLRVIAGLIFIIGGIFNFILAIKYKNLKTGI